MECARSVLSSRIKNKLSLLLILNFSSESDCPSLDKADSLSQTQLIKRLTHTCRYDRLERPVCM